MNPILLRYAGFALVAAIFGVGGGYLAVKNERPTPPSGTTVAIPAQPFPGQGIRAVPAIPAIPQNSKPDIGKTNILFIGSEAGKNQVVNPKLVTGLPTSGYLSEVLYSMYTGGPIKNVIVGMNFSPQHNNVFWDGKMLVQDVPAFLNSDGNQNIYLPVPESTELGSYHTVYVKGPYGTSNEVRVQAVEHLDTPWYFGFTPASGPVGTKGTAKIFESMDFPVWLLPRPDAPLSTKIYLVVTVPASEVKSGATGFAYLVFPSELQRSSTEPTHYSFTVPKEAVYCPSWGWDASECSLAPANTMVPLKTGYPYWVPNTFFVFEYKYRGIVKGFGNGGDLPPFTDPATWYGTFTITP